MNREGGYQLRRGFAVLFEYWGIRFCGRQRSETALICPDGYPVQLRAQEYFDSCLPQITLKSRAVPLPARGRFAIVTNVGHGMRWTQIAERNPLRGRAASLRTAKSCGPDAPTLASSRRRCLVHRADDGGEKARSPRRARSKPLRDDRLPSNQAARRASGFPCALAFLGGTDIARPRCAARTRCHVWIQGHHSPTRAKRAAPALAPQSRDSGFARASERRCRRLPIPHAPPYLA